MLSVLQRLFYLLIIISFCFVRNSAEAQQRPIEIIPNQPFPEAYDLLKDSKGYLWVAHELGISRYDGAKFINLSHPQQSSISMTDMVEDKQGRIWCHNFSGQIFYIENLQLHLLTAYKYLEEQGFPRITICGDELVATSAKGLFVYNLRTAQSTYHYIPKGTNSLVLIENKVICFNGVDMFSYEAGKSPQKVKADLHFLKNQIANLHNVSLKDTFFLAVNRVGSYYKLTLANNTVKVHTGKHMGSFINTISQQNDEIWINTKENSFTTDGKEVIHGLSLSDVITDNQGNRWMSSLKKGLCVQYNSQQIKKLDGSFFSAGDNIRRIHKQGETLFLGTSNGSLYRLNGTSSLEHVVTIPKRAGSIERIFSLGKDMLLLAASLGSYSYNLTTNTLQQLAVSVTVKDVAQHGEDIYLGSTVGVMHFTLKQLSEPIPPTAEKERLGDKVTRCRSITLLGDSLVAAYSDGVFIIHRNKLQPLLFRREPLYATTIRALSGKLLIGTFTQGLFILENGTLKNISEKDGLASEFVKEIKTIDGTTWLVYADRVQQLNKTLTGVEDAAVPFAKGGITDFSILNNQLYITTGNDIYSMLLTKPATFINSTTHIDKIVVNEKELVKGSKLRHFENHLRFQVSTPFYSPHSKITYQYRIKNAPNSAWQQGSPGQTAFNVVALEPGRYSFEIVATDESRKIVSRPAIYQFEIMPPWQQRWYVRVLAGVILAGLGFYLVRVYYLNRLRKQRMSYEKELAVQAERQRISAEIHDDVGAGLSAIRLLTEITKEKLPESEAKQEVGKIHASISELSHKMREVIWSLNTENDYLENLLYYIRRQALVLFENSSINLKVVFPSHEIPAIAIKGEKRRHIYLSVKEALHNCLKHSSAQNCTLTMGVEGSILRITVTDDGRGFALSDTHHTGNGLTGMKRRMQQISGSFEVDVQERTSVQFMVPLNERT